jgi:hypothetical protein
MIANNLNQIIKLIGNSNLYLAFPTPFPVSAAGNTVAGYTLVSVGVTFGGKAHHWDSYWRAI